MVQMDNVNDPADFYVKLKGLDESQNYKLTMYCDDQSRVKPFAITLKKCDLGTFSGEILMKAGLHLALSRGDNMSTLVEIEAI